MHKYYSLAHLTVMDLTPPAMLRMAAQAGYQACGLRLAPFEPGGVAYGLMDDPAMMRETLACMRDTGLHVEDIEIIRLDADFDVQPYQSFFEAGQRLGARHILVTGEDPDRNRLVDAFARLCEAAAPYGLTVDMEFMPWLAAGSVADVREILEQAGQPNGGVLVDPIHLARSISTIDDVAALPSRMVHYAQICDASATYSPETEALIDDSRHARLLPGEGAIDLARLMGSLPPEITISVEIANPGRRAEAGTQAWIEQCLASSRRVMETVAEKRH